ncbi:MAG: NAD(P)H-dependent oxidoreductase subunit E [Deltaproteobacteria bacterium]|nr:MAG: NAD(P)H-dependent oxidoreductase subunit E [Deltaproteobacteria bacterium]
MELKVKDIIEKYGSDRGSVVPILQDVQKEFNYLPKEALNAVSSHLDVAISRMFEVATFYKAFSLTPRGRHQLSLCVGTACYVRGAPLIESNIERVLDLRPGKTSPDLEFSFDTVNCLGSCALGPILVVDGEYQGQITVSKTNKILKKLGKKVKTDES